MKKRIFAFSALVILVLTISAQAIEPRESVQRPRLTFRACLESPRTRLGGVFSVQTSLKTLAIRQDCGGFLPCWTKNPLANPRTLRS